MIPYYVRRAFAYGCTASFAVRETPSRWPGSPFEPLRSMPSLRKSAVGIWTLHSLVDEKLGVALAAPKKPASCRSYGKRVMKIKTSVEWEENIVAFEQIRTDERYDCVALLAFCPQELLLWVVPREPILAHSVPQHAHKCRWYRFDPQAPPEWLNRYGGTLDQGLESLRKQLRIRLFKAA